MTPIRKGTKLTDNPKCQRLEIRLTVEENNLLESLSNCVGTSKTDIIMRGVRLVQLQKENSEFEDLSNCLIIRELGGKELTSEDKTAIMQYVSFLKKKYE